MSKTKGKGATPFKFKPTFKARPVWATFDPSYGQAACKKCGPDAADVEVEVRDEEGVRLEKRRPEPCELHATELAARMLDFQLRYTPRKLTEKHGKLAIAKILEPLNEDETPIDTKGRLLLQAMLEIFDGWKGLTCQTIEELCSEFYGDDERDGDEAILREHCETCQGDTPHDADHWHEAPWDSDVLAMLIEHGRNFFGIAKSLVQQVATMSGKKGADRKNESSSGVSTGRPEATETTQPGGDDSTATPNPSPHSNRQDSETS